jgi:hypothetical protein
MKENKRKQNKKPTSMLSTQSRFGHSAMVRARGPTHTCPMFDMFPALAVAGGTKSESVLFIGTQFSNLYTTVNTPAEAA